MKKRILTALLVAGMFLLTACQANNAAVATVNYVLDAAFYGTESEVAMSEMGISSQDLRNTYLTWSEEALAVLLIREDVEEIPEDEIIDEIPIDEIIIQEVNPIIREMSMNLIERMQDIVTYSTKIMTMSSDNAVVKVSITAMDMQKFYTDYVSMLTSLDMELPEEELLLDAKEQYKEFVSGIVPSSTPMEFYVELFKIDDVWRIGDVGTLVQRAYTALTGN